MASRGLDADELLHEAGLSRSALAARGARISWPSFVRLCNAVSRHVHHDPVALRAVGAALAPVEPLAILSRYLTSPATFYEIVVRWVAPANFPHLRLYSNRSGANRYSIHGVIPPGFEPCEAFLQISVGATAAAAAMLGGEPATILDEQVTDRTMDVELRLPSARRSVRRSLRTILGSFRKNELLEAQRLELADGLAAARRAQAELRALLERLPDMVVIHVEGRIRYANRAFIRTMGWASADEVVGRTLFDVVDPRSRRLLEERLAQPPDALTMPELEAVWLRRPDGEAVHAEIVPTQAVVFDGEAARLIVGRDIGDRERLQQKLVAADRLASLGLLAAGVAHEVNNPLAYLLNNIEIARRHLGRLGEEAKPAADALQVALEGVDRIRFIVRELLQLARVETSEVSSTDLGALAQSTLSLARAEIESTARVTVDIAEAPAIRGSVPRVAQIILNLVINATDAMRDMPRDHNELVVRVRPEGHDRVMLEVSDTGAGVPPVHADRIFDPFFTTKPGGVGTGLGLTITQRLVADLDGEISFTSTPGRGTTFRVLFPVSH